MTAFIASDHHTTNMSGASADRKRPRIADFQLPIADSTSRNWKSVNWKSTIDPWPLLDPLLDGPLNGP
jgi:hypothetical protein